MGLGDAGAAGERGDGGVAGVDAAADFVDQLVMEGLESHLFLSAIIYFISQNGTTIKFELQMTDVG